MPSLKIVTQLTEKEGKSTKTTVDDWLDDCGWASLACAANHLTGSKHTCSDGIEWGEKVGRHDRDGLPDPTSLSQIARAAKLAGVRARWARDWADVEAALKAGWAVIINVEQAKGYPPIRMSAWHRRLIQRKGQQHTYGHMVCAAVGNGILQFACPTMTGVGPEESGVPVTWAELRQIASSKGDAPHKRCLIITR